MRRWCLLLDGVREDEAGHVVGRDGADVDVAQVRGEEAEVAHVGGDGVGRAAVGEELALVEVEGGGQLHADMKA